MVGIGLRATVALGLLPEFQACGRSVCQPNGFRIPARCATGRTVRGRGRRCEEHMAREQVRMLRRNSPGVSQTCAFVWNVAASLRRIRRAANRLCAS